MYKSLPSSSEYFASRSPLEDAVRNFLVLVLRSSSRVMARLAQRVALQDARQAAKPQELEFYADAGAPEGALYADGKLVGYLPGVTRL
jgi:hypothetical protein